MDNKRLREKLDRLLSQLSARSAVLKFG